jgi:hypothetical protein
MSRLFNLLTAVGAGAALIYFFDPVSGRRRRAQFRDKLASGVRKAGDQADARFRDLKNRAYGTYHELRKDVNQVVETTSEAARKSGKSIASLQETGAREQ